jgi:hypothetical protein
VRGRTIRVDRRRAPASTRALTAVLLSALDVMIETRGQPM